MQRILDGRFINKTKLLISKVDKCLCVVTAGGELFMQLEREGIFMEDTAW